MRWGRATIGKSQPGDMQKAIGTISCVIIRRFAAHCPGGEIGRRRGLKIPRRKACRFDSGPGHQQFKTVVKNFVLIELLFKDLWLSYE